MQVTKNNRKRNPVDECKDEIYDYIVKNSKVSNIGKLQKSNIIDSLKERYDKRIIETAFDNLENDDVISSSEAFVKFYKSNDIHGKNLMESVRRNRISFNMKNSLLLSLLLSFIFWSIYSSMKGIYTPIGTLSPFENGLSYGVITMLIAFSLSSYTMRKIYIFYHRLTEVKNSATKGMIILIAIVSVGVLAYWLSNKDSTIVTIVLVAISSLLTFVLSRKKS